MAVLGTQWHLRGLVGSLRKYGIKAVSNEANPYNLLAPGGKCF
jgi:hypothetical protein